MLADGQKVLLAIKSIGESTEAWRTVLDDLIRCGLRRSEFLFVDGAPGLDKTIAAVPDGVPVQRCTVISCVSYNLTDSIVLIPHGESQAEAVRGAVKMARRVRPTRCSIVRAPRPPRAAVPGVMMRARRSKAASATRWSIPMDECPPSQRPGSRRGALNVEMDFSAQQYCQANIVDRQYIAVT